MRRIDNRSCSGWPLPKRRKEVNPFPFRAIAAGPQLIQQLEAIDLKFDEAFNKHDATAVGAIPNVVQKTRVGSFSSREGLIVSLLDRRARMETYPVGEQGTPEFSFVKHRLITCWPSSISHCLVSSCNKTCKSPARYSHRSGF